MTSTSYQRATASSVSAISNHLDASARAANKMASDTRLQYQLSTIVQRVLTSLSSGGKLLICGNGGSAADAQHIAAEFVGRYKTDRDGLPAIALTTDSSVLTAVSNDFSFDRVFARQIRALGKPSDLLWAISTSGHSPNIHNAVKMANAMRMQTVVFTAFDAPDTLTGLADMVFKPFETDTAILQQLHMIGAHAVCDAVERALSQ